ncbi:hypothetical protein [Nonomuraea coxensis]|uniref:hypothetical protein n=1 Tax=Nonomuraea coxensis TaxID=404386 RepID=UPI000380639B|nr:hypothetical protein [Nonomuraea coxensis]
MNEPDAESRQLLDVLRADPESWSGLGFAPAEDDDTWDANAERRAAVLAAILFDPRAADRALLRFLLQQDIREAEQFWGVSDGLRLGMLLLAEHRCVDDAWLQWSAKIANFDTEMGLDLWAVLAGGVVAVRSMVAASDHPERDELLERLAEEPYVDATDEDVERWLLKQRIQYFQAPHATLDG